MKKVYRLLLALVLTLTGATTASADKVYEAIDFGDAPLKELTEGQQIALWFSRGDTGFLDCDNFLKLNGMVTESCVFELESAGEENLYYLKCSGTGRYVQMSSSTYSLTTVEAQRSASTFYIVHPTYYSATADVPADCDPRTVSVDPDNFDGAGYVININAWSSSTLAYYLSCYDTYNYVASDYGTGTKYYYYNTWMIYSVREIKGLALLQEIMQTLLPSGSLDSYIPGTNPGCIPQEVFDELQAAYDAAQELVNESSTDDAACEAAATKLQEAVAKADASVIQFSEGYYIFTNYASPFASLYVDVEAERVRIQTEDKDRTFDHALTVDDVPYIWKFEKASDNTFYLYNPATGYYMGVAPGYYYTNASTEQTRAYELRRSDAQPGAFVLLPSTSDSYALAYRSAWGNELMLWYYGEGQAASAWNVRAVSDDEMQQLNNSIENLRHTATLQALYLEGGVLYAKGLQHTSDASQDANYPSPIDGLVTMEDQISTNAQHAAYGPLGNVLDGDLTSFFQSNFGVVMNETHYIEMDLGDPVGAVELKFTRPEGYYPTQVQILASNDQENWFLQGVFDLEYTFKSDDSETADCGLLFVPFLGDNFQYVRFCVIGTESNAKYNGNLYFRLSEIRAYEAEVDASLVGEDLAEDLWTKLGEAAQKIASVTATEDDVTALQASIEAYRKNVPDPESLRALITEYRELISKSAEGTEVGQYAAGSFGTFNAALTEVESGIEAGTISRATEITEAREKLEAAFAELQKGLVGPEGIYFIRRVNNQYLYAYNTDPQGGLYSGGYSATTGDDANLNGRLGYMWNITKNADGSYNFQNVGYGHYVTYDLETTSGLTYTADASAPTTTFTLEGAGDGRFYVNAEGRTWKYYSSYLQEILSNTRDAELSPLSFVKVDSWDETFFVDATANQPFALTLPVAVGAVIGGTAYEVKGVTHEGDTGTLELAEIDLNTTIEAGTPVIIVSEGNGVSLLTNSSDLTVMDYSYEAKNVGGLQGTFVAKYVGAGNGFFSNGQFLTGNSEDYVNACSGVVVRSMVVDSEKGDLSLPVDGTFVTSIALPQTSTTAKAAAYDLQGRRVLTPQRGLYIIGGKKVLVK